VFVCFKKDHLAEKCPRWKEPNVAVQFMGSASKGLGFFHVDVEEKENMFKLWNGFDNCGVFTIEDDELDQEGIISHLRKVFDNDWPWQLKTLEDYKYLVRFPPDKKVENFVTNDGTYFYLNGGEVMASLKIWNGDIVPVGKLEEVWVQVKGIPPKWCDWETLRHVASTLGKLTEVDWQSLFGSFFAMIRIKIKCRDPSKVPKKRIMEMKDEIFLISFKTEGFEQIAEGEKRENDDGDGGDDDNLEEDDLLDEEEDDGSQSKRQDGSDKSIGKNKEVGECSKSNS
jgi:hypothetical protein